MVTQACDLSIQEAEALELEVWGQSEVLHLKKKKKGNWGRIPQIY